MDSGDGIAGILNKAAFNSFYVSSLSHDIKYYFSYCVGRLVILSDKYPEGIVNVCVIPVRKMEGSNAECASKIQAAQEHFRQKRIKKPWFVMICEDDVHEYFRSAYAFTGNLCGFVLHR